MCRSIKTLFNLEPPVTDDELQAAALQFVRKISGATKPSRVNQQHFDAAVQDITRICIQLMGSLETSVLPKDRAEMAEAARARAAQRYGKTQAHLPSKGSSEEALPGGVSQDHLLQF